MTGLYCSQCWQLLSGLVVPALCLISSLEIAAKQLLVKAAPLPTPKEVGAEGGRALLSCQGVGRFYAPCSQHMILQA